MIEFSVVVTELDPGRYEAVVSEVGEGPVARGSGSTPEYAASQAFGVLARTRQQAKEAKEHERFLAGLPTEPIRFGEHREVFESYSGKEELTLVGETPTQWRFSRASGADVRVKKASGFVVGYSSPFRPLGARRVKLLAEMQKLGRIV